MDKEQLLAQLRDAHLPPDPSWWPLALGWWILIGLFFIGLVFSCYKYLQHKKQFKHSTLAIQELNHLLESSDDNWLIQLQVLLRRVSLCYFSKQEVANLQQQEWLNFLTKTGQTIWSQQSLQMLKDAPYQAIHQIDKEQKEALFSQSKAWIQAIPKANKLEVKHV